MGHKYSLLTLAVCLAMAPLHLAADGFSRGFAESINQALQERRQREFERELLERRLEHEREMLLLQQSPPTGSSVGAVGFPVFPEIDFMGGDITESGIRGVSLATCVQICADNGLCQAVTWVPEMSWCWPKGRGYIRQINEDVVSVQLR